jgi:hypothetical protein
VLTLPRRDQRVFTLEATAKAPDKIGGGQGRSLVAGFAMNCLAFVTNDKSSILQNRDRLM